MENHTFSTLLKNPKFILTLILVVFFLKGVFLATLFPIFNGQDEHRHYNTIQYLAELKEKPWITNERIEPKSDSFQKFNYTEEIKETARATDYDITLNDIYSTTPFITGYNGKNETEINNNTWNRYNEYYPRNIASPSLYHYLATYIEKVFNSQNILVRYHLVRIFSVLLGTITILLSYLIARTIGFSAKISLILTAIIAFQPRFAMYTASINYDILLILLFTLFTLAGVLILKKGLDWKNLSMLILSIYLAVHTKPTGYILLVSLVFLLGYILYKKIQSKGRGIRFAFYFLFTLSFILLVIFIEKHLSLNIGSPARIFSSISEYLSKSLTMGRLGLSSRTYWGTLGWVNSWSLENVTNIIWYIEALAAAGVALLLLSKNKLPEYLPTKKYVIFLVGMILALQLGIRTADWSVFNKGGGLALGTPGRYFLPNLASHIILVFVGLGAVLAYFKKERYFEPVLTTALILMFSLTTYLIFDVVILRFYF